MPKASPATADQHVAAKPRARSARRVAKLDPTTQYATDVAAGKIVAGPYVRAACERHLRDLVDGSKRGLTFSTAHADYWFQFFTRFLRLNGGQFEGIPFELQQWQQFIVGSLFGWLNADGMRRFRTAYIEVGKGNGKSPLIAGIGLGGMVIDQEPRAEIYAAATKKDQAMILFRDAVAMVDQSPELARRLTKSGTGQQTWNLAFHQTGSFFRPISSDDGQAGPRPHIALVDELHEHKTADVVDNLRRGVKGRRQPLVVEITNSGVSRTSICYAHRQASIAAINARSSSDKGFDDTWFAYVCALDEGDSWLNDPTCWKKANPNLGVSIPVKYLEDAVREARNIPSRQNMIARLNFCVWTEAESAWIGFDAWDAVQVEPNFAALRGRACYAGLDLSSRRDLTALALFFPDDKGGGDLWLEFWTPRETMAAREDIDGAPYSQWVRDGVLSAVPGSAIDYRFVIERLARLLLDIELKAFAYDRWRIEDLRRAAADEGLELPLLEFGQGFKDMSPAVEMFEEMILNKTLRVHRNPVLTWNAASAVLEQDPAGSRKFTKRKATGRIDGVVASTMAVGKAVRHQDQGEDIDAFLRGAPIV